MVGIVFRASAATVGCRWRVRIAPRPTPAAAGCSASPAAGGTSSSLGATSDRCGCPRCSTGSGARPQPRPLPLLAALAVEDPGGQSGWFDHNQALARRALEHFPGLASRYARLVAAHLAQRPRPERLPGAEAARERAIRAALERPGSVPCSPRAARSLPGPPVAAPGAAPPRCACRIRRRHERRRPLGRVPRARRPATAARRTSCRARGGPRPRHHSDGEHPHGRRVREVGPLAGGRGRPRPRRRGGAGHGPDRRHEEQPASGSQAEVRPGSPAEAYDDQVVGEGSDSRNGTGSASGCRPSTARRDDAGRGRRALASCPATCGAPPSAASALPGTRARPRLASRPARRAGDRHRRLPALRHRSGGGERHRRRWSLQGVQSGDRDLACLLLADLSLSTDTGSTTTTV